MNPQDPQSTDSQLTASTQTAEDPWNLLLNAGSDGGIWMLLGGPFLILLTIAGVYSVLIAMRRRKERRDFIKDVEEAENPDILPLPTSQNRAKSSAHSYGSSPEEVEALTGQPIKPYPVPKELVEPEEDAKSPVSTSAVVRPLFPTKEASTTKPAATTKSPVQQGQSLDSELEELKTSTPKSLRERVRLGLTKTREAFQSQLKKIFAGSPVLGDSLLEELHETLYRADFGVATSDQLVQHVKETLKGAPSQRDVQGANAADTWNSVVEALRHKTAAILQKTVSVPLKTPQNGEPWVILIVGVNGVGKTTTIGKLAAHFKAQEKKCLLVAADTFRAAAIEQLSVWGSRLDVDVIKHQSGSDPAAVAFDGIKAGLARKADVVLIDTAGRLHAKTELMAELGKINRILSRDLPQAPHETWLVIDATTGQNAVNQVKAFKEVVNLTGLVVTKLDGTAKGGVIVGISEQFKIPVRYIGVGEKAGDLRSFNPEDFAEGLF